MILPTREIVEPVTFRLVPSAYHKPPVLRALVDDDDEAVLLAELEGLTSRRLKAQRSGLSGIDQRELLYRAWGHTHVNAAFAYTRIGGNRFNDETRGAWYCAMDDMTPLHEVAYHRTRELENIGRFIDNAIYVQLIAGFVGVFHDICGAKRKPRCLHPDPALGYPAGQALARKLRADGSRGLLYPSVRRKAGRCLVAFEPAAVQNVRHGAKWRVEWKGSREWSATGI